MIRDGADHVPHPRAATKAAWSRTTRRCTNEPLWTSLSIGTYASNIRNGRTGARRLDLPLVSQGARPIDLIRRPALNSNEHNAAPLIYDQRFFGMAASASCCPTRRRRS